MTMGFSRRDFLKTSGALVVYFGASSVVGPFVEAQGPFDTHSSHVDPEKLDSWLAIASDGSITAYTLEVGTPPGTSLPFVTYLNFVGTENGNSLNITLQLISMTVASS